MILFKVVSTSYEKSKQASIREISNFTVNKDQSKALYGTAQVQRRTHVQVSICLC